MEFRKEEEKLNFIDQQFAEEPLVNIISKEKFEERVSKVFNILWERLSMSFGPGGAGTFISVYPNYYNTKDGFNIMKNLAFDKKLDQVICDMVMSICSRLNFTVGDGTTTAVIATKSMYDEYQEAKPVLDGLHVLPRDIMKELESIKDELLVAIDKAATPIRSDDPKTLRENIAKVVSISSNGDEKITNMIADLYEQLMYPAISCTLASDGITKSRVISGYKLDTTLTDKIYINNDNNTMVLAGADYLVFDHKVTQDTYMNLLKPLSEVCSTYGRHLVCIAPYYDETALSGVIKTDLNKLYSAKKDIPLVLTVCSRVTGFAKTCVDDLAMLLNTTLITSSIERTLIETYSKTHNIFEVFNIDNRDIDDIVVGVVHHDNEGKPVIHAVPFSDGVDVNDIYNSQFTDTMRVGYCDHAVLGLKESSFSGFYYDPGLYDKYVSVANDELAEVRKKCESLGTYSSQLSEKQKRVYALGLKTGVIEVGATSEISQGYLKDTFDDAIKAAESAYNNGVVLGCNVSLVNAVNQMRDNESPYDVEPVTLRIILLSIVKEAFVNVYRTVLSNVIQDETVRIEDYNGVPYEEIITDCIHRAGFSDFDYETDLKSITGDDELLIPLDGMNITDIILIISLYTNTVFDISSGKFNKEVINSAETDKEILKATIDLLSLLITGNQLVLR